MQDLAEKRIVVGVSGGIAAYKTPELIRRLKEAGAEVRVVMTANSKRFVGPLTFQAVSGQPVHDKWLDADSESGMGHIDLARWADMVVIAPATAAIIARLAHGMADDLLTTLCITTGAKLGVAPAMNQQMWAAPATQANVRILEDRGVAILGPGEGDQACGETGPGRMLEPTDLLREIHTLFGPGILAGERVVITAGPTWEAIDPVRGITNHSSGRMGYAVARAAAMAGARVTLITGPTTLPAPPGVDTVPAMSAQEMHEAALSASRGAAVFIGVAAVADYRPERAAAQKIKKTDERMQINLVRNPDILADVAALPDRPFTVGFAAETENLEQHAREKLLRKNVDLIAANDVGGETGFGSEDNDLVLIDREGVHRLGRASKADLAHRLVLHIAERISGRHPERAARPAD
ncbi:MAG: bifunctional phosphopantothenoylcysteine decarboxylase/phosphopantothenate--cysteine ligase CoaBC [Gammaproteobacteria bacterium]|nr:bifunctional phosphopantothenoylcysteine decarboxylase/phosphopantothenate--cysteine ligase CoaBC [Gammaproteobacteria bacterium]